MSSDRKALMRLRTRWVSAVAFATALSARAASAEVTIIKGDTWEAYAAGRVGAFFTYGFGDAYPVAIAPMGKIVPGGGVENGRNGRDLIPKLDASGAPDPTQQGTLSMMRVRSGYIPNVLGIGFRKRLGRDNTLKGQVSMWGTIESAPVNNALAGTGQFPRAGGRSGPLRADFREGYMQVEGPWGGVTGGRFMSLFSRGIAEIAFLYGHGYGVGFPGVDVSDYVAGSMSEPGPTAGMVGFGVLAATYSAGLVYFTPNLGGLKLTAGVFEPVLLQGAGWGTTRAFRPETEVTYDMTSGNFKMHLFGNGSFQKLYNGGTVAEATMYGAGYGGRFEVGPVHIGGGGHYGKGVGLSYAFDGSATSSSAASTMSIPPNELRTFAGFSAFGQLALGEIDLNVAFGQTQVKRSEADLTVMDSVIKTQTGIAAGVVYHLNDALHFDVDFINTSFAWYGGEKQRVNFVNTGVTLTF
jgi:hypothetical protein